MKWFLYFLLFVMLVLSNVTIIYMVEEKMEKPRVVAQFIGFLFNVLVIISFSQFLQIL